MILTASDDRMATDERRNDMEQLGPPLSPPQSEECPACREDRTLRRMQAFGQLLTSVLGLVDGFIHGLTAFENPSGGRSDRDDGHARSVRPRHDHGQPLEPGSLRPDH